MRSVQVSEPKGPLEVVERDIPEPGYDKEPSEEHDYYKEKYRDMLLKAAETILGYFVFDSTIY